MLNVNMNSSEGVTLATAGKYCADNVKVVPSFDHIPNARKWSVTIAGEVTSMYTVLTDEWINANRTQPGLTALLVKNEAPQNLYEIGMMYASNKVMMTVIGATTKSYGIRCGGSNSISVAYQYSALKDANANNCMWARDSRFVVIATTGWKLAAGDYTLYMWY